MITEYKNELRKNGIKPPKTQAEAIKASREYRKVPEERLIARLGLTKYDIGAPLEEEVPTVKEVKLLLSQHIGVPAHPLVKEGDTVKKGDIIAKAGEGLSVAIHASIDATVKEVTNKYIRCER